MAMTTLKNAALLFLFAAVVMLIITLSTNSMLTDETTTGGSSWTPSVTVTTNAGLFHYCSDTSCVKLADACGYADYSPPWYYRPSYDSSMCDLAKYFQGLIAAGVAGVGVCLLVWAYVMYKQGFGGTRKRRILFVVFFFLSESALLAGTVLYAVALSKDSTFGKLDKASGYFLLLVGTGLVWLASFMIYYAMHRSKASQSTADYSAMFPVMSHPAVNKGAPYIPVFIMPNPPNANQDSSNQTSLGPFALPVRFGLPSHSSPSDLLLDIPAFPFPFMPSAPGTSAFGAPPSSASSPPHTVSIEMVSAENPDQKDNVYL